ncbi:MAG: endonuclease, partial [Actinomycetia bacterium]|nr:endonuclease [Actinomycetes bacterium]
KIAAVFATGAMSWDQLRALTYIATPDTDGQWAGDVSTLTVAGLELLARMARRVTGDEARERHKRRRLHCVFDDRIGMTRIFGVLTGDEGMVVKTALERLAVGAAPDPISGHYNPEGSMADALVELASTSLSDDTDADRATIVVHADAATVTGQLEDGTPVADVTLLRHFCDARVQVVINGMDGEPLGVGRTSRNIPPWLMRLLRYRDQQCRFPACPRRRWVHAHHLHHWIKGGATDLANLVLLCNHHHHLVHEHGWHIRGDPNGPIHFIRPDGTTLHANPPPLRDDIRTRLFDTQRIPA